MSDITFKSWIDHFRTAVFLIKFKWRGHGKKEALFWMPKMKVWNSVILHLRVSFHIIWWRANFIWLQDKWFFTFFFCNTTCTFPKRDLSFPRIYHQWKLQCGLMNNFFSKVRVQQYLSANKNLHLWIKREKCFKLFLITKPVATSSHEIITKQQWWNCILKCDKKTSWRPSAGHISKIRRPK